MSTNFHSISAITNQPNASDPGVNDNRNTDIPLENSSGMSVENSLLKYLTAVDKVIVQQTVQNYEGWTNCGYKNTYRIRDSIGRHIYKAVEDSNCCIRNLCFKNRPLDLKITDEYQTEVIHMYRGMRCQCCFFPCCLQRMEIYSPPSQLLGVVQQEWSLLAPNLSLQTADGEILFKIKGPICTFACCNNTDFIIYDAENGEKIGKITKKCSGLINEALSDDSSFGMDFPLELEAKKKAMLLGALFLIDLMYFERYCSDIWFNEGC